MINAWHALADDIMTFLIARGVRPTPHRYAVVSHLADHGGIDERDSAVPIGEGGAAVNRAIPRRVIALLLREGIVEADGAVYRLRPAEAWGERPDRPSLDDQRWAAAG